MFLKWFFSPRMRRERAFERYKKRGVVWRIFVLLLMTIFTIGTLVLEYIGFKQFGNNIVMGIVILIFAAALGIIALDTDLMYCGCALRMCFRKNKEIENNDTNQENENVSQKSYKSLDIVISILGLILVFGLIIGAFLIPINLIKK